MVKAGRVAVVRLSALDLSCSVQLKPWSFAPGVVGPRGYLMDEELPKLKRRW